MNNNDDDNNTDFHYIRFEPDQDDPEDKGAGWFSVQSIIGFIDYLQSGTEGLMTALRRLYQWWRRN